MARLCVVCCSNSVNCQMLLAGNTYIDALLNKNKMNSIRFKFLTFLLCFCVLVSCSNEFETTRVVKEGMGLVELPCDSIYFEGDVFKPRKIMLLNQFVVIYDDVSEGFIKVFDPSDENKQVASWGRLGDGPGSNFDYVDRNSMEVVNNQLCFMTHPFYCRYIFNSAKNFLEMSYCDLSFVGDEIGRVSFVEKERYLIQPYPSKGGGSPSFLYANCGSSEKTFNGFGNFPNFNRFGFESFEEIQSFYLKSTAINPTSKRFFAFYRNIDRVELFDANGNVMQTSSFSGKEESEVSGSDKKVYFVDAYPTEEYAYALYLNRSESEMSQSLDRIKSELLVWSWDGNLVSRYQLNGPVFNIAIDEKNGILYGLQYSESHPFIQCEL